MLKCLAMTFSIIWDLKYSHWTLRMILLQFKEAAHLPVTPSSDKFLLCILSYQYIFCEKVNENPPQLALPHRRNLYPVRAHFFCVYAWKKCI